MTDTGDNHDEQVVSNDEWLKARLELLAAEKEFTRHSDALTRRRLALPWECIDKNYLSRGRTARSRSPISSTGDPS